MEHFLDSSVQPGCSHPEVEHLGNNNGAVFLRCRACAAVIVSQGRLTLIVPPVSPTGHGRS
jgi:hypothetical protein